MGKLLKVVSPVKAIMSKSRSTKEKERKKLNDEKEKNQEKEMLRHKNLYRDRKSRHNFDTWAMSTGREGIKVLRKPQSDKYE